VLDVHAALPKPGDRAEKDGLRIFSLESALIGCSPQYFSRHATDARAALPLIRDASGLLRKLLDGGHSTIAGRLAGAFRNSGRDQIADEITKTMLAAGYSVRETDPFDERPALVLPSRETSPYVNRIRLLWQKMREPVIERFPKAPGLPRNVDACMKRVAEAYVIDAYPSLSIEGYRVTTDLIQRVRSGLWNPEKNDQDRDQRSAMAARGYWQAYQEVQKSIAKVLGGENAGAVADDDHRTWYREMFAPSVTADILKPSDLAPRLPGLHLQVHARAPEPRGGKRCHAGVVRTAARGGATGSKGCARALCIRVHPSLQGRERAPGAVSDEPHDGGGRISLDGDTGHGA